MNSLSGIDSTYEPDAVAKSERGYFSQSLWPPILIYFPAGSTGSPMSGQTVVHHVGSPPGLNLSPREQLCPPFSVAEPDKTSPSPQ